MKAILLVFALFATVALFAVAPASADWCGFNQGLGTWCGVECNWSGGGVYCTEPAAEEYCCYDGTGNSCGEAASCSECGQGGCWGGGGF